MDERPEHAIRAVVSGRVQGVGYRMTCATAARRLGVAGYVRNLPDGRVEVVAAGAPAAVEALVAWCRQGPPGAAVTEVAVEPASPGDAAGPGGDVGGRFVVR